MEWRKPPLPALTVKLSKYNVDDVALGVCKTGAEEAGVTEVRTSLSEKKIDGMNIISNDGSNKLNRSRKARVSYQVQRTINASLNAATSTRAVSSNPNFVTRQKIEIIFG